MSWLRLKTRRGQLKIKPRWQLRSWELERRVPILDLGLVVVSWWSTKALQDYNSR